MRCTPLFLLSLVSGVLLFISSCTGDSAESSETKTLPDIGYELSESDLACLEQGTAICEAGLPFALLGQSMLKLDIPNPETIVITDEIMEAGGYYWNQKTLNTPSGAIVLEGDFVDDRATGEAGKPENNRIFRIRVEARGYETQNGIQVESNLGDLFQVSGDKALYAQYIPDYQSIQIGQEGSRILYLIRDENSQFDELEAAQVVNIEEVPDGISIYAIVLIRDFE